MRVLAILVLFGATDAYAEEERGLKEKFFDFIGLGKQDQPAPTPVKAEVVPTSAASDQVVAQANPSESTPNQSSTASGSNQNQQMKSDGTPAVTLKPETVTEVGKEACRWTVAAQGINPERCNEPDFFKKFAAEQAKKREAEEARRAKLEEEKRKLAEAKAKAAEERKQKAAEEARRKLEIQAKADAERVERDRKARESREKAEAERAERDRREREAQAKADAEKAERDRREREARQKAEAENARQLAEARKAAEDAQKRATEAERIAMNASNRAAQLEEGQKQKTSFPPQLPAKAPLADKRADQGAFSAVGLVGAGVYYGIGAVGKWTPAFLPAFLDGRISAKMGIGGVQISNSDLDDRGMDSVNRLYWNPSLVFNIMKRDGFELDAGPAYTWIGRWNPHLNTVRGFGIQSTIAYKRVELMLGLLNNSVNSGLTDENWNLHGSVGYRVVGF